MGATGIFIEYEPHLLDGTTVWPRLGILSLNSERIPPFTAGRTSQHLPVLIERAFDHFNFCGVVNVVFPI